MRLVNSTLRYGAVAMLLHWGMAALLIALLATGWYMVQLPDAGFDGLKISLILGHKSLGMLALALVALRVAWRSATILPQLTAGLPEWQQVAARFAHLCFYALMLALPVTGWVMSSAGGFPVFVLFDKVKLPELAPLNPYMFKVWIEVHRWLADAFMALLLLHILAALWHHTVARDDTLRKMLP